jgi:GNAT superfamily N-acetyltransferase
MTWTMRLARPEDAERLAAVQLEGFESYRSFAPPGWDPPDPWEELDRMREHLGEPEVWCLIAEQDGDVVGQVAFMPARIHGSSPSDEPGLAHFWQLFVREPWWGTGLATALHAEAVREAAARGFTAMRLYTPAGQARARRFYEREGWTAVATEPADAPEFGMPLVEYRLAISSSV